MRKSFIKIIPVADARNENFPLIIGVDSPLEISDLSIMNPRTFLSSHRAQTMHTSAIGAFVIHVFEPFKM